MVQAAVKWLVVFALGTFVSMQSWSEEIPEHFTPVRPSAMGGAFTAVANDESAIWSNPAGIGRTRKQRSRALFHVLKVPNVIIGANKDSRNFYDVFSATADSSVANSISQSRVADKPLYIRAAAFPVAIFDKAGYQTPMAGAIYSNTTAKVLVEKDTPTEARVEATSDIGGVMSFGFTDASNLINFGIQLRPVLRYAYSDRIPSAELPDKQKINQRFKDDANQMYGLGIDAGILYTIADFWYPTIGVAILNVPNGCKAEYLNPFTEKMTSMCGNVYRGDINSPDALSTVDPMDTRIGLSITPRFAQDLSVRFALDIHQIPLGTESQSFGLRGVDLSKLIHFGAELFLGNPLQISPLAIRGGYSQGFVTAGATVDFGFMHIDFATYGRDVSSTSKPLEDRRYLGSLSFAL